MRHPCETSHSPPVIELEKIVFDDSVLNRIRGSRHEVVAGGRFGSYPPSNKIPERGSELRELTIIRAAA